MTIAAATPVTLPAINGNSLFWAMAAIIAGLSIALLKMAGALFRGSRQAAVPVQQAYPGGALELPRGRRPRRGEMPGLPVRRRRGGGRLLIGLALIAGVALAADKVMHFSLHSAAPGGGTPAPAPKPAPKAPVKVPAPRPVTGHPVPTAPVTITHTTFHFPLSGTELTIVAVVAILGLVAYGINRVMRRSR
jgi:hypothetical protein